MSILPLVSVNIRTLNSAKTLEETLLSIKNQSYPHIEIVISDGHSADESVVIAKRFGAKVNYADKLGDARYQNYKNSRGEYIISLDSDQILDKKLIEVCVKECESKKVNAIIIAEKSVLRKGTLLEKLLSYDKWVIDKNQDSDAVFGTACPRFFKKSLLKNVRWPKELTIFDDTILYSELLKHGAKVSYISSEFIRHYEVSSWIVFIKKFYRYGKGYFRAFQQKPGTITAHSLPRRSYFSFAALSKPHYFLGLLLLYFVKVTAATAGMISYLIEDSMRK